MKRLFNLFVNTWDALDQPEREKILDEVSPHAMVKSVVMSLSARRDAARDTDSREDVGDPPTTADDEDEEMIEAEFVSDDLEDGFGA